MGDLNAFKSCLRALGYDLPMVEEGDPEPEFESILNVVDPNRDGFVTLQEYMAFMVSKETENVQSSEEIENAFRAITAQERDYVTQEELYSNHETLRRPENWPRHNRGFGLYGVYSDIVFIEAAWQTQVSHIFIVIY